MNDFEALVLLNMTAGLGSISIIRLIREFKQPKEVFKASEKRLLAVEGITSRKINEIKKAEKNTNLDKELKSAKENNINIVTILDKDYPENLKNIYDPPPVLYVKGGFLDYDYNSIAIVGSRRASFYGLSTASSLSAKLSELGITIVSGLARGIDTASHKGALAAGGRTIAALGSGLLNMYPPENKKLSEEISNSGAVVSEFSLNTPPLARNFPSRNRIISGLSLGVVVVEAARNSGALITADLALQQGREVFAVPGKMDSVTSIGTHNLIKQGAKLISNTEDIIEEIVIKLKKMPDINIKDKDIKREHRCVKNESVELSKDAKRVYEILSCEPLHIDEIMNQAKINIPQLSLVLMQLQFKNIIKELPGKNFVRV